MTMTTQSLALNRFKSPDRILGIYGLFSAMTRIPSNWVAEILTENTRTELFERYFLSEEWQAGEKEADKNLAEGNYQNFDNIDDLISYLHEQKV